MNLNIVEIVFGRPDGSAVAITPRPDALSYVKIDDPTEAAQSVIETLSQPRRTRTVARIPFVRVSAANERLSIAIADDASARIRVLDESFDERIPLIVEARTDDVSDDANLELMLSKLANAMHVSNPDEIAVALTQHAAGSNDEVSPEARAYVRAHQLATQIAAQVRAIDDQMTASVVPGWLFVACGVGGFGVLMTAVTLFNPELRIYVIPGMFALLVFGLAAYAWQSWQELKTRGALQDNRTQLRDQRESARESARALANTLIEAGIDPNDVLARTVTDAQAIAPLITTDPTTLSAEGRQTIVFVREPPEDANPDSVIEPKRQ